MSETAVLIHHSSERLTPWAMVFKPPTQHSRLLNQFLTSDDRKRMSEVCTATDFRTLSRQPLEWTDAAELWAVVDPKKVRRLQAESFDRISRATHVRRLQVTVPARFGLTVGGIVAFPPLALLTELILDGRLNSSLTGIGRFPNLRKLTLGDGFNQNLDPLILLPSLRELTLGRRFGDRRTETFRDQLSPLTLIPLRKLTMPAVVRKERVSAEMLLILIPTLRDLHLIEFT